MITESGIIVTPAPMDCWQSLGQYTHNGKRFWLFKVPAQLILPCGSVTKFDYAIEVDEAGDVTVVDTETQRSRLLAVVGDAAGGAVGKLPS